MNASCWYYQKQLNSQILPVSLLNPWALQKKVMWMPLKWGKDRKQLATRNTKDMCTMRNESILTTSLHLHCSGGAVSTTDLSWKNLLRSQTRTENKLKINWCIFGIVTLSPSQWDFRKYLKLNVYNVQLAVWARTVVPRYSRLFMPSLNLWYFSLPELEPFCKFLLWYSHGFIIYASFLVI